MSIERSEIYFDNHLRAGFFGVDRDRQLHGFLQGVIQ